jgi:hypothetical protein
MILLEWSIPQNRNPSKPLAFHLRRPGSPSHVRRPSPRLFLVPCSTRIWGNC